MRWRSENQRFIQVTAALSFATGGKTYAVVGYFAALVYPGAPLWQLYSSAVLAPKARFVKQLPTLMAVWKSWHPNGHNPAEGSHSAEMDKIQRQFREQL